MHGVDFDTYRLALQPREVKFDLGLANAESQAPESIGRRGFKGITAKAHQCGYNRNCKASDPANSSSEENGRKADKTQTQQQQQQQPSVLHRAELGCNFEDLPDAHKAPRSSSMRVVRRAQEVTELKKSKRIPKLAKVPRALAPSQLPTTLSLFVEGNSMLPQDACHASQALKHLSDCVTEERHLRDVLEKAKRAKLKAFRDVTRIYLSSLDNVHTPSAGLPTKLPQSLVSHPDPVSLARCAVVSNTLVSTIQSYMRYRESNQLTVALRRFQHLDSGSNLISSTDFSNLFSMRSDHDREMNKSATVSSGSVEDLLDMEEINKLKQLYFDYFECEIVDLDLTGSSQLSESISLEAVSPNCHARVQGEAPD